MDTAKSHALLRVLEMGSVRKAAAELGYTPSGISRMLQAFEGDLGIRLLNRSKTGVAPTPECEQLLPYLKAADSAARACENAAREISHATRGTVRIGTAYPEFFPQLTAIMHDFKQTRPDIELNIVEARSSILNDLIEQGKLDFALMSKRDGAHGWHEIAKDALVALVPASHPLAQADAYPFSRFETDPFIEIGPGEASDNRLAFNRYGIAPNVVARVQSAQAAQEMVGAGLGVTLSNHLHATSLNSGIAAIPVSPALEFSIGAATSRHCSPAARLFSQFAISRLSIEKTG